MLLIHNKQAHAVFETVQTTGNKPQENLLTKIGKIAHDQYCWWRKQLEGMVDLVCKQKWMDLLPFSSVTLVYWQKYLNYCKLEMQHHFKQIPSTYFLDNAFSNGNKFVGIQTENKMKRYSFFNILKLCGVILFLHKYNQGDKMGWIFTLPIWSPIIKNTITSPCTSKLWIRTDVTWLDSVNKLTTHTITHENIPLPLQISLML